jgi:membrane-bound ClpP family serine protease
MLALALVLVVVALVLFVAEAHLSTGGLLGVGAAAAVICAVALLTAAASAGAVAVIAVGAGAAVASGGGLVLMRRGLTGARRRPQSGPATMAGHLGVVRVTDSGPRVFVDGALWHAQPSVMNPSDELHDGDRVIVEQMNGLTLYVRKAEELELYP